MPIVLTQNETTVEGHSYNDVFGVSYEYPTRYRHLIRTGGRFVYYRGRRTAEGPPRPQVYLGVGLIGKIGPGSSDGLLTCVINDYKDFPAPLSFKDGDRYFEEEANRRRPSQIGLFFRQGARPLTEEEWTEILRAGLAVDVPSLATGAAGYPDPATAAAVDDVAMECALTAARVAYAEGVVRRMPHNNPGFDILVELPSKTIYIEVKGTMSPWPRFFMSEGEREFSETHPEHYALWMVTHVDLDSRTGSLTVREGPLSHMEIDLRPTQWYGELPLTAADATN